ncbi:MAG: hypothetical protein WKG07_03550 [Hymenobacter sp.]
MLTYSVGAGSACPVVATRRVTLLAAPVLAPVLVPGPLRAQPWPRWWCTFNRMPPPYPPTRC